MRILLTGGSGFIGEQLLPLLLGQPDREQGDQVILLTRKPHALKKKYAAWDGCGRLRVIQSFDELQRQDSVDAVINLAGEGIADKPWTNHRRQELHASRVLLTESMGAWLIRCEQKPEVIISGSAVGWYGHQGERILDEKAKPEAHGFAHELCQAWEQAATNATPKGTRLCLLRLGVVIGPHGGMLRRLLPVFSLGLGGALGSGEQYMSWISRSDVVQIILRLLTDRRQQGIFNLTAPAPLTNAEFTRVLAGLLKRPAFFRVPATVLKLAMGEMSTLLLEGQRVIPTRLLEQGYRFVHPTLEDALRSALARQQQE